MAFIKAVLFLSVVFCMYTLIATNEKFLVVADIHYDMYYTSTKSPKNFCRSKSIPSDSCVKLDETVDDEENPLVIAKTYLERIDSEMLVNVLSSPEEALNIYHTYQCIITDYKMPKMDGFELARRIRNESNIPIILYTGWGDDELFEKAKI